MSLEGLPDRERETLIAAVDRYADMGPFATDELLRKLEVVYRAALPSLFERPVEARRACVLEAAREAGKRRAR